MLRFHSDGIPLSWRSFIVIGVAKKTLSLSPLFQSRLFNLFSSYYFCCFSLNSRSTGVLLLAKTLTFFYFGWLAPAARFTLFAHPVLTISVHSIRRILRRINNATVSATRQDLPTKQAHRGPW